MIIDFHTHIFPDKIAGKTIELLSKKGNMTAFADGTVNGLLNEMEAAGVDISVILPVMTAPTQFDTVNRFAMEINQRYANAPRRLISFAGIHPLCEDIDSKMKFIRESGFLGVKIHPDYQETFINDDRYVRILECAKEYDLIVTTHSGVDAAYRDADVRCTPDRVLEVIRKVKHSKFVLAHYGANEMFDEAIEKLCGEDVFFDTAYVLRYIDKDTFLRILEKHGADKILFATDSPWSSQEKDVKVIRSFLSDLSEKNTEEKIFCENAKKLLGIGG